MHLRYCFSGYCTQFIEFSQAWSFSRVSLHDFENGKNFRLYTLKKISYFFKVFPFFCWRQFSTCTKWAGGVVSCSCMCHFMCAKCVSKGAGNCSKTHSHHLSSCRTWENSAITIGGKDKEQNSGKYILKHTGPKLNFCPKMVKVITMVKVFELIKLTPNDQIDKTNQKDPNYKNDKND